MLLEFFTGHNTTIRGETASSPLQKWSKTSQNQARFTIKAIQQNQFLEGWGTTSAKILRKQIQSVYILFSPKFQRKQTPDLVANRKGDKRRSKCKQTPNRVHTLFLFPSNSYSSFWRLRWKPWSVLPQYNGYIVRQSTMKLRLRRLKTKDTCTFCFRNTPTGKTEQTFTQFAQPPGRNQPCHQLCAQ